MKACIKEVEQLVANKVLDEVKKEVEKLNYVIAKNEIGTETHLIGTLTKRDTITLLEKLKVNI